MEEQDVIKLKRCVYSCQRTNLPPIVTHNILNENDQILTLIRKTELFNGSDDRVKVSRYL